MKKIDLTKLSEGNTVEFKEQFDNSVLKAICAFANTDGGVIY